MFTRLKNVCGFSIKELFMTLVVMGILCALAIPPYFLMQETRHQTLVQAVLQNLETKIKTYKNEKGEFPQQLDSEPTDKVCQSCFSNILEEKLKNQNHWYKTSATTYSYSFNVCKENCLSQADYILKYDPLQGSVNILQIPSK